jgi:8-oxo-dGTP diphosphatase
MDTTSNHIIRVGIGVLAFHSDGRFLLGKRKSLHGEGTWGAPGGHLEFGESFEDCVKREMLEETSLAIDQIETLAVANHLFDSGKHYVTIFMAAKIVGDQQPVLCEPDKCEVWQFFDWDHLPDNLFVPYKRDISHNTLVSYKSRHRLGL